MRSESEMQRAARAARAFLLALERLQGCWKYNGAARCTHLHDLRQAAQSLLPLVQQFAAISVTSD